MTLEELEAKANQYMLLEDKNIIYMMSSFLVGNRLPLPPPWVFLVTSSAGGKTKLIQLMESVSGYFDIDDLTSNTLLSGIKKHDGSASLLHKIQTDGFLVFRDFTTILSKKKEVMGELMAQLRMVYDGKFTKHTGMGEEIAYKPKKAPGLFAGVTTKIYTTSEEWADMGERMIMYRMKQPKHDELGMWILDDEQDETESERELKNAFAEYVNGIEIPLTRKELPKMDHETKVDLVQIAKLAVVSRSPIERLGWKKDRIFKHDQEMIGRLLKQLRTLGYAMMLMDPNHILPDRGKAVLYKMALDSIPKERRMVLKILTQNSLGGDINQIAEMAKSNYESIEPIVEDLNMLGMLIPKNMYMGSGGKKTKWSVKPEYLNIISKFEHISPKYEELPETEEQENDPFLQQ